MLDSSRRSRRIGIRHAERRIPSTESVGDVSPSEPTMSSKLTNAALLFAVPAKLSTAIREILAAIVKLNSLHALGASRT